MFFNTFFPVVVSAVAMVMDLRTAKVDNGWLLFSLTVSFIVRLWQKGVAGIPEFLLAGALPLIIPGVLFCFRMIGAGDVKLFCVLGGILGVRAILKCVLASLFLGACISVAILISEGSFSLRFHYFIRYIDETVRTGRIEPYRRKGITAPENFHFTVPVFLSAVLYAGGVY